MATVEELKSALIKAHNAGDYEAANLFASKIKGMQAQPEQSLGSKLSQGAGDLLAGGLRGAGSIGATLLAPVDYAVRALNDGQPWNVGGIDILGQDRRQGMTDALGTLGANTDSIAFKTGKLAGEIAGTAGAGGVVGNAIARAAPAAAPLAQAVATGGMRAGGAAGLLGMGTRIAGGALNGAATSAMVDPSTIAEGAAFGAALPPAVKVMGAAGSGLSSLGKGLLTNILGATTGAGSQAVKSAFEAGKNGATSFLDNMRGKVDIADVVDSAKSAVGALRQQRAEAYKSGMVDIKNDVSVIPFSPVQKIMDKISGMGSYKGVQINKNAAGTVDDLKNVVDQWGQLDPAEYHTPEGMDALKQAIGDIRDSTDHGTAARRAADEIYNAVKTQITAKAPAYAKVMGDYASASKALQETEKALSLGEKASQDTAVRKLQSLLRNNAQTNYGNRMTLAQNLEQASGVDLMSPLAGQAMNSWMPRGLVGAIEQGNIIPLAAKSAGALLAAPIASPRLVGEGAYMLGRAAGKGTAAMKKASQGLLGPQNAYLQDLVARSIPLGLLSYQSGQQ